MACTVILTGYQPASAGKGPMTSYAGFVPGDSGRENQLPEPLLGQPWFLTGKTHDCQRISLYLPGMGMSRSKGAEILLPAK
jgi:hypothetical protein